MGGRTVAPPEFAPFFAASMGAAAAFLGLLFVAVSVAPERTVGLSAPPERHAIADSCFTAMIDAFFVSMGGAIPGADLGSVALILGVTALTQTLYVGRQLWPRPFALRSGVRRMSPVLIGFVIYCLQIASAVQLLGGQASLRAAAGQVNVLYGVYAFAMVRSWQLLGARRGMISSILGTGLDGEGGEDATSRLVANSGQPRSVRGPDEERHAGS